MGSEPGKCTPRLFFRGGGGGVRTLDSWNSEGVATEVGDLSESKKFSACTKARRRTAEHTQDWKQLFKELLRVWARGPNRPGAATD